MKIYRILRAWFLLITFQKAKEAKKRFSICVTCDKFKTGKTLGVYSCGVCGCPIIAKVRDLKDGCPHPDGGKW